MRELGALPGFPSLCNCKNRLKEAQCSSESQQRWLNSSEGLRATEKAVELAAEFRADLQLVIIAQPSGLTQALAV